MRCKDFLEQYSAYRDGLVPELSVALEAHLETCPSCRAYDRAVRLGVDALRESRLQLSPGFEESLRARLEQGGTGEEADHPQPGTAVPATATVLLLLAVLALALRREPAISTAAAEANPPAVARPRALGGIPFVAFVPNP